MLLETMSQFSSVGTNNTPVDNSANAQAEYQDQSLDDTFLPRSHDRDHQSEITAEDSLFLENEVSDIPRLRSTHNTAGYRDGVSASKEIHVQDGFDEGYALGAEIGSKVGWILGILEGLAGSTWDTTAITPVISEDEITGKHIILSSKQNAKDHVRLLLIEAKADLTAANVYGQLYFQEDGDWKYDIPGSDHSTEKSEVIFRDVANAHPLLSKWTGIVVELAEAFDLDFVVLESRAG